MTGITPLHCATVSYPLIPSLLLGLFLFSLSVQGSGAMAGLILLSRRHKAKASWLLLAWGVSVLVAAWLALRFAGYQSVGR
ncbi:hypothetical protein [Armatimonas rosea]|uniref:Glycerol uptake facilitator-like aquaporin n=1 Tax=Armatimonas rosea TaxID=685828 RepID=A0A7W9W6R1_ARMRO|nr:hypothetical protein [Armatimonas rosea]MBB6049817.1 glycerol uptake facilitator-like aquaporin [Armatimonas rosea]